MILRPTRSTRTDTLVPDTTLCRSMSVVLTPAHALCRVHDLDRGALFHELPGPVVQQDHDRELAGNQRVDLLAAVLEQNGVLLGKPSEEVPPDRDRKSTRLNSSH